MSDVELLKAFRKWKDRVGGPTAASELVKRKVSLRTVQYLIHDDYKQSPRRKLRRALEEIVKLAS